MIKFFGSISTSKSALRRSGSIEGGASVTFDIPESGMAAYKQLCDAVGKPLLVAVRILDENDIGIDDDELNVDVRAVSGV